jgi:hypothetical protein
VQQPRPPIWCVGVLNRSKTMERARRWDGLLPQVIVDGAGEQASLEAVAKVRAEIDATSDRPYDIVIEGNGSEHSPAAWADAGATWWIESMWDAVGQAEPTLAILDRLRDGPPR